MLKPQVSLAPMAGYSDRAMRKLCMEYGADLCYTEMVSAKGLVQGNRTAWELLEISCDEQPCVLQLFSDEPENVERAIFAVQERISSSEWKYSAPVEFNINCGCPAKKIAGNGGGAALMRDPELADKICAAAVKASSLAVSVKHRLGWNSESRNAVEFAQRMEAAGAARLIVHGRTREQMYAPPVDLEGVAAVKRAVSIPVIANGDVTDGQSAMKILEQTDCDGVMVGRGALGRPWVFAQIKAALAGKKVPGDPDIEERGRVMLRHIRLMCQNKGEKMGMRQARSIAHHYFKGLRGAAEFRAASVRVTELAQLEALVIGFLERE
ncbi:MAG: tRNA dihydrouridine synthase DusB [Oscillospiraceae bacterium]|nr:tRNA dihydrouridine synthase DusB [Oscillospiraceae bacterium]